MSRVARNIRLPRYRLAVGLTAALAIASTSSVSVAAQTESSPAEPQVIPAPVTLETTGDAFWLRQHSMITVEPGAQPRTVAVARQLAEFLRTATGYPIPVARQGWGVPDTPPGHAPTRIRLSLTGDEASLGQEGYTLDADRHSVRLAAATDEGLFRATQTLRQLLPAKIESDTVQPGPWAVPGVHIVDYPRYEWRGSHLDVARHFLSVDEVKRYIDLLALYKVNRFHLHLSDDQGWRIQIDSWPDLTRIGGSSEVGGGPGGFFTKADYTEIVEYAAERYITVVPEIDMPGHTNAAEVSYPVLNSCRPDNLPSHRLNLDPPWNEFEHHIGTQVGFSALCVHDPVTYEFVADVVREISAITPGPYFHVGGDEAHQTPTADYVMFMNRVRDIVEANGKIAMGWAEIAQSDQLPGSIAQHWSTATGGGSGGNLARMAVAKDMNVVMSPANRIYLDMKYAPGVPPNLGLTWAGTVEVMRSYDWNPGAHINGVTDEHILGVEAPLWTETILNVDDAEHMAYPRMAGVAEIGWTPQSGRDWEEYRLRLAAQADRWDVLDVNYYRSPQVWLPESEDGLFSTMANYQDFVLGNMADGELSTLYWTNRAPASGDYFGLGLGSPTQVSEVEILMASTSGPFPRPDDYVHNGVVEVSTDALTWQTVATVSDQPEIVVSLDDPVDARWVRLRATASQSNWVQVREFTVSS